MIELYNQMISRQIEVFTPEEQEKLRTTPVTVLGCGGLGGTIIEQLVRTGFENITIIDQDVFDKTNLNRQIRSNLDTINKSKVEITKEAMLKINPNLNIIGYDLTITPSNIAEVLEGTEVLIDAVDNVYTRVMISREAKKQGIAFIHSAVEKTLGQLTVIDSTTPSYEELFKLKSYGKTLDESKEYLLNISTKKPQVLGITPSIFGALEVNETIKYILKRDDIVLAPKILLWDIFDISSFRIIEF
ncbi:HesA/MoeB/ThiF family protein [Methanosphaera sp. WGK6]|uniref:HesA/MoeB/ThiF family protein n=1 Tax=Methanosphaera sp. WGK6 TaxID=1561964 RepID=UPI00084C8A23|nr:HesA/MoeB/ThiF family protein [Methanosphaera sp. WGK6]OED30285.1 hypothetical protein NL43_03940 [Methanosphaera sp. WGK6]